ncbi:MAG: peptidase M64, partial [Bacteroidaceae bacterium]|nr:peptidase M64 [Bacteroidaceae bacterium]
YTNDELPLFYQDAQRMTDELFKYEPFKSNKHRFNVLAVGAESQESGVSEPAKGVWKQTACGTFFDFLYMKRLIGVVNLRKVNDLLAAVPYEHIVVLANSSEYGGCGVYNSYDITPAHHAGTLAVFVHEFGHSFGGLGDEYFYDEMYTQYYYPDVEPWHENLTTLCDFQRKWADMLPKDAVIPTPPNPNQDKNDYTTIGVFEGGGNQSKGVYRPAFNCRMRTNSVPDYCPVCRRGLQHVIDYHLQPMR